MRLIDVVRSSCIDVGATYRDKAAVLQAIARLAHGSDLLAEVSEDEILTALRAREALCSTGFGDGIAIPHCRLAAITRFVVGLLTIPSGVNFDSPDNEPVNLVVFIIAPEMASDEHIQLLSEISQALLIPGAVREITQAPTPETVREAFLRHVRDELKPSENIEHTLFHVFVQRDDLFRELMKSLSTANISVIESQPASVYLEKLPLFTGFFTDSHVAFSRIIVAVIPNALANATLRDIEKVTGPLDECRDVLVTIQSLHYAGGALQRT